MTRDDLADNWDDLLNWLDWDEDHGWLVRLVVLGPMYLVALAFCYVICTAAGTVLVLAVGWLLRLLGAGS